MLENDHPMIFSDRVFRTAVFDALCACLGLDKTDADRAAHKAMPISVALTLAGSIESIVITVNVQQ